MKIKEFNIRNFKGIKNETIELSGDVITLIGLNESGKTTILEALSNYMNIDKNTKELVDSVHKTASLQEIIPISRRSAFSNRVTIKANIELEARDLENLRNMYKEKHSISLDLSRIDKNISIERAYSFEDSQLKNTMTYWSVRFPVNEKGKKTKRLIGSNNNDELEKKLWLQGVELLQDSHPKIAYFPTFLFDFPDRIYISPKSGGDSSVNSYYYQVIQDVLDGEGSNLNLQKHIIDRIEKFKSKDDLPFEFLSKFSNSAEKRQVDAVMQKVSNEMTRVIFGAWNQILGRKTIGKRIQIDWSIDAHKDDAVFLEVSVIDGESKYSLSERSLGFRWFFSFLLLTQFRRNRKDGGATIFLFDEPAANLHSRAQVKLLESFTKIAGDLTKIIYSTHSHYMINPKWLESAYIISNDATDVEFDDDFSSLFRSETDITATKYRAFVGGHPSQTTYFQPVLDALDVGFSPLVSSSHALIVEGKFDYFPILYFRNFFNESKIPGIFPANGAGNAGRIISLFRGWGVKFCLLLDGDQAGKIAKEKYKKEYFLSDDEVVTLGDLDPDLVGKPFESVFQEDVRDAVKQHFSVSEIGKRHFSMFFQELVNIGVSRDFPQSQNKFKPVSEWIDKQLDLK